MTAPSRRFRLLFDTLVASSLFLAAGTLQTGGIKSERLLAAIIRRTPQAIPVGPGEPMKRAESAAASIPGTEAFWGGGSSMEPLYSTCTAIVVAPLKYKSLEKGMTVVCVNR